MSGKDMCRACARWFVGLVVAFLVGYFGVRVARFLWEDSPRAGRCPEQYMDDYYFQKLETFVDPRDSNEYTVLKFAEYRGCTMSELDPGFLAGDTVTFHLFVENLRYRTPHSRCLDSACARGRYYPFAERGSACPAGWTLASAMQNAALYLDRKGRMTYYPTFSPIKAVDPQDPSGLARLRSRPHDGTRGWVDTLDLNLSGFYNPEKGAFEYVDSLSVVWTSDGYASVISPNGYGEQEKAWTAEAMKPDRMNPLYHYPVRCIRIDDPRHKMDSPESGMVTYYNNMRMLPYLYR